MWQSMLEYLAAIHFQHPAWLWALLPSLLAVALLMRGHRLRNLAQVPDAPGVQTYRHPRLKALRQLYSRQAARQRTSLHMLRNWSSYAVVLLCVHLALAQPYRLGQELPSPPEYRDTVFIIDMSLNMILRDYLVAGERTDRMTIMKSVLTHFIEQLKGNRVSLIVFSERAYTLVPLTADYNLLKSRVHHLEAAVLTGRSTDIGGALLYTLQQLQQADASAQSEKPALVLLTDVNRSNRLVDPRAVAAYLQGQGYRLHTIGIGASSYDAEEKDAFGLIYHPANFALLEAIAERGGGKFFWADNVNSLQGAIQAIQSAERRQVNTEPRYTRIPLYQWPLFAGLLFIVLIQLLQGTGQRSW